MPLTRSKPSVIGEGSGGRGGRISLNDLAGTDTSPANPPQGGRLSRLAQARSRFEAEKKGASDASDWLDSLRSDNPAPPPPANTAPARPAPVEPPVEQPAAQPVEQPVAPPEVSRPLSDVQTPTGEFKLPMQNDFALPVDLPESTAAPSGETPSFELPDIPAPIDEMPDLPPPIDDSETYANPALGELADDTTLPDWLKSLKAQSEPATNRTPPAPAPPPPVEPEKEDDAAEAADMPQWLRDFAAASSGFPEDSPASAKPAQNSAPQVEGANDTAADEDDEGDDLPDWLRSAKIDSFIEPEAPQKDILDWLKGPSQMQSEPPPHPTFGDVDVEERLNFAFDEPETAPSSAESTNPPPRQQSGLTGILGFSPYAPDEVQGQTTVPNWQERPTDSAPPTPEPAAEFPAIPDFLSEQTPAEPATASAGLPFWLDGLQPPVLEVTSEVYTPAALDQLVAEGYAAPAPATQLVPWLEGLAPPELAPSTQTPVNLDTLLNNLPPVDSSVGNAFPAPNFGGTDYSAGDPQAIRERGTRPFSVGAMFHQTDYLSERFMDEGAQPRYPEEEPYTAENTATLAGAVEAAAPASDEEEVNPPLSDDEALTDWLASLPALPDLEPTGLPDLGDLQSYADNSDEDDAGIPHTEPEVAAEYEVYDPAQEYNIPAPLTADEAEPAQEEAATAPPSAGPNTGAYIGQAESSTDDFDFQDFYATDDYATGYQPGATSPAASNPAPYEAAPENTGDSEAARAEGLPEIPAWLENAVGNETLAYPVSGYGATANQDEAPAETSQPTAPADDLPPWANFETSSPPEATISTNRYTSDETPGNEFDFGDTVAAVEAEDENEDTGQPVLPFSGLFKPAEPEEAPALDALNEGKPPTFELPEFLNNLDNPNAAAATPAEPEQPSWQQLYKPDKPIDITAWEPATAAPDEAAEPAGEAGETEKPAVLPEPTAGVIAPATPVSAENATGETTAQQDPESEWNKPWDDAAVEAPEPDQSVTPPAEAAPEAANPDEEDIPPWLKALSAVAPPEPAVNRPSKGYTELNAGYGSDSAGTEEDPGPEIPDWLKDDLEQPASLPTDGPKPQPKGTTVETRQLPEWLQETAAPEPALPPIPDFPVPADAQATAELPDWLKEPEAPALTYSSEDYTGPNLTREPNQGPPVNYQSLLEEVPSQFSGTNFFDDDVEGPAWLRQTGTIKPAEPLQTGPAKPTSTDSDSAMPSWLRTVAPPPNAPVEPKTVEPEAAAPAEEVIEEPATEVEPEDEDGNDMPSVYLPPRLASAAVLETLLMAPTATVVGEITVQKRPFPRSNLLRYLLYILLIGVALFGLLQPLPVASLPVATNVQTFYDQIDRLPANAKVLVAFDWEADRSGEMSLLSTSVVQHIMAKRARLLTVSLNPQGPALAARITDNLATNSIYGNSNFYKYGSTYLNLGWRSGQEVALRSFFDSIGDLADYRSDQPVSGQAAASGINSLQDFNLIVVLAGDEGSVRAWVEQVGVQPGMNMVLGVPLAVEPVARPYAQGLATANPNRLSGETQPRAQALLAGLNQTAQYDQLLQDKLKLKTDPTASLEGRLSAQSLAALLLVLVIIVGNVIYLARRRR